MPIMQLELIYSRVAGVMLRFHELSVFEVEGFSLRLSIAFTVCWCRPQSSAVTACFLYCFLCHDYRQCQMTVIEVKENEAIRTNKERYIAMVCTLKAKYY